MGWDMAGMESDGLGLGLGWNGMGWDGMGWDGMMEVKRAGNGTCG